jgi:hypothetical protein
LAIGLVNRIIEDSEVMHKHLIMTAQVVPSQSQSTLSIPLDGVVVGGVGLLVSIGVSVIAALLNRNQKAFDQQQQKQDERIRENEKKNDKLERELLVMSAELSEKYVHREDWIRYSNKIDANFEKLMARMDLINEKIDKTNASR